ncbi:MAG: phosphoribosylglycinamide formyltransferase [Nitrospirae bacterium]|nr:phosphoribosylglycinamide formyltransferase [Nitrospirota bacterium]
MTKPRLRLGVLASGRGSNLQAIIDACGTVSADTASNTSERGRLHPASPVEGATRAPIINAAVEVVISDQARSDALERARRSHLPAVHLNPKDYASREKYDDAVVERFREHRVDLVVLAGYMRLITSRLIGLYRNRIINIHPSLLPAFPGLRAQRQALEWGVRISGCTVHFVDETTDQGPIIIQAAVPVLEDDTEETLAARVLEQEHRLLPQAIQYLAEERLRISGRRVILKSPKPLMGVKVVSPMIEIGL